MTPVMERMRTRRLVEQRIAESCVTDPPEASVEENAIDERVLAGAALLDKEVPGWHDQIDLERFNIRSARECVLGLVYEHDASEGVTGYDHAVDRLYLDPDGETEADSNVVLFGFHASLDQDGLSIDSDWDRLQEHWGRLIVERQSHTRMTRP